VKKVVLETGHSSPLLYQEDIVASGGLGVCDGAHWLDVMKKVKSPGEAAADLFSRSVNVTSAIEMLCQTKAALMIGNCGMVGPTCV